MRKPNPPRAAGNRSTNRLRRKSNTTHNWIETKVQVKQVLDDGRRIDQAAARGNYGSDVAQLWAALRTGINDLARAYGLQPWRSDLHSRDLRDQVTDRSTRLLPAWPRFRIEFAEWQAWATPMPAPAEESDPAA